MPLLGADCDPIAPAHCGLPFPSNVWRVDGKVTFGATTLPALRGKAPTNPTLWLDRDGFSPGQSALVVLPGATATALPNADTIAGSIAADSPSVLMDAETGEKIPHFVDLDSGSTDDQDRALLFFHSTIIH